MVLHELVRMLLDRDALGVRQWISDAARANFDWSEAALPDNLDAAGAAVAAGVVELMAQRAGKLPPPWTASVPPVPSPIFLVKAAESMARLRRQCEEEGPWALRKRRILAPPEFLTFA